MSIKSYTFLKNQCAFWTSPLLFWSVTRLWLMQNHFSSLLSLLWITFHKFRWSAVLSNLVTHTVEKQKQSDFIYLYCPKSTGKNRSEENMYWLWWVCNSPPELTTPLPPLCVTKCWRILGHQFGASDNINHFLYLFSISHVFSPPFVLFSGFIPPPSNQSMTSFDLDALPPNTSALGSLRTAKLRQGLSPGQLPSPRALRELHWGCECLENVSKCLCRGVAKGSVASAVISQGSSTLNRWRRPTWRHSDVTQ